jgi:hypothetical protein
MRSIGCNVLMLAGFCLAASACKTERCDLLPCTINDDGTAGFAGSGGIGAQGGSGGANGGGGAGGMGGMGAGGTGGAAAGCVPNELAAGESLDASCGVFVDFAGSGAGTKDAPTNDLQAALQQAQAGKAVYICGTDTFTGSFTLEGGISIYGALNCDWTFNAAAKPKLVGNVDVPTLVLTGAGATRLEDLELENPNALAPGASSIGLLVSETTLNAARLRISTGNGAAGAAGVAPGGTGTLGGNGTVGGAGCVSAQSVPGGAGSVNMCGGGVLSAGGDGGNGNVLAGGNGTAGDANPPNPAAIANAGSGDPGPGTCTPGGNGAAGQPGGVGLGGGGLGVVTTSGFSSVDGQAGQSAGGPGQGGGGGGGARGADVCVGNAAASGGGGGAGGCGGAPGSGGGGGGSSISIVVFNAAFNGDGLELFTQTGGVGGAGSSGQPGGGGGQPGLGGANGGCAGGQGGQGGRGGAGGGGLGGHSLGIAIQSNSEPTLTNSTHTIGNPGAAGLGGNGGPNNLGGTGDPGQRCLVLDFDTADCIQP